LQNKKSILDKKLTEITKAPPWLKYVADNGLKIDKYEDGLYRWYKLVVE
jgi:hypothetical protein